MAFTLFLVFRFLLFVFCFSFFVGFFRDFCVFLCFLPNKHMCAEARSVNDDVVARGWFMIADNITE